MLKEVFADLNKLAVFGKLGLGNFKKFVSDSVLEVFGIKKSQFRYQKNLKAFLDLSV